jgi:hypothetical protein
MRRETTLSWLAAKQNSYLKTSQLLKQKQQFDHDMHLPPLARMLVPLFWTIFESKR